MLTEERRTLIIRIVEEDGSASIQDLMAVLDSSESTIRRDLNELDKKGLLVKVHGGAMAVTGSIMTTDAPVAEREDLNQDKKRKIGRYAASLIGEDDVVFLDAGTTTGMMIEYLTTKRTVFFTNAVIHARRLAALGYQVYLPGGILKSQTEALVGSDTTEYIKKMNFTKGFFGVNGITMKRGFTTPDRQEAAVKECAFLHSKISYVLADSSKFEAISASAFGDFEAGIIITDEEVPELYRAKPNVYQAE